MASLKLHSNKVNSYWVNSYWKRPSGKLDLKSPSIVISPRLFVDKVQTGHNDLDYGSSIFYLSF